MAVTFAGNYAASIAGVNTLSGNESGSASLGKASANNFSVGAATPAVEGGGGYSGSFTAVTGGTLLNLATTAGIVISGGSGSIAPAQGYVVTALKKLRALYLKNTDASIVVTVAMPTTLGVAGLGWTNSEHIHTLHPGGVFMGVWPTGSTTLTAGTNDGLLITSASGSPTVDICAVFG